MELYVCETVVLMARKFLEVTEVPFVVLIV